MVEIFPYYVRTKGLSWFQLFGRTAVMFGVFLPPSKFLNFGEDTNNVQALSSTPSVSRTLTGNT
jgi:hypothetical protein